MYRLLAEDLESEVYYSISGTDAFDVDARTGIVKLSRFLNKNVEKLFVVAKCEIMKKLIILVGARN